MAKVGLIFFLSAALLINQNIDLSKRQPAKAKWDNLSLWREKLVIGMPAVGVENLLGKPLTKIEASDRAEWYYQALPSYQLIESNKKKTSLLIKPDFGCVLFKTKKGGLKPIYFVESWNEPDKSKPSQENTVKKMPQKPVRLAEKYEKPSNWKRLTFGMPDSAVRKILGEPFKVTVEPNRTIVNRKTTDEVYYYLNYDDTRGVIYFMDNKIREWDEPYWPQIEKALYEDPNQLP
jgi:hypothetical protein